MASGGSATGSFSFVTSSSYGSMAIAHFKNSTDLTASLRVLFLRMYTIGFNDELRKTAVIVQGWRIRKISMLKMDTMLFSSEGASESKSNKLIRAMSKAIFFSVCNALTNCCLSANPSSLKTLL